MRVSTKAIDVTYETHTSAPLFNLPRKNIELLKAIFERINPRYAIGINDMQASGGESFSDVKVQVGLFGGRGTLAVFANKFVATFTGAQGENDIKIIQDCINMSLDALKSSFEDLRFDSEFINSAMTLELLSEPRDASAFLGTLMKPSMPIEPASVGATQIHQGLKVHAENKDFGTYIFFDLARSVSEPNIMFFHAYSTFSGSCPLRSFDEKVNYYRETIASFLKSIGVVPETGS